MPCTSDQHWSHVAKHLHSSLSSTEEGYQALTFAIAGLLWLMPIRPSPLSGGYSQQNFRPWGHSAISHWGSRPRRQPAMGYDYQQRGVYPPPQSTQYRQPYGGYQQQLPPRGGGFGTGWDQRPAPGQSNPTVVGYDYYCQGSHPIGTPSNPMSNHTSAMYPGSTNYNYGAPDYGHPALAQPNYGQGYTDTKYASQAPNQHYYGQQSLGMQSGAYGQQASTPQDGQPQSYNKSAYGVSPQDTSGYGPPRATQPSDPMYQGSAESYAANAPSQPYPYGANAPQQQAPAYIQTYGPTSGATDVYAQPLASYAPQVGPVAPGGQSLPAYSQPSAAQPAAYGQYPASQQSYAALSAGSANYGYYHGVSADAGYDNTVPTTGYSSAPPAGGSHPGYVQPAPNPSGYYDQSAPTQAGYDSNPAAAPASAAYAKSVSPQPAGYGVQYDGAQVYGQQ